MVLINNNFLRILLTLTHNLLRMSTTYNRIVLRINQQNRTINMLQSLLDVYQERISQVILSEVLLQRLHQHR